MPEPLMLDKSDKRVNLHRLHNKIGCKIVWQVMDKDGRYLYGIIEHKYDPYLTKKVGFLNHHRLYWMYHRFYEPAVGVARTRKEIIEMLITNSGVKL